ncbi:MAG: hypothetical protein JRN39_00205 [Nitrososphaerota archaeon]|nr:hypothetical protein [Nitrososphaerota archaeon]
MNESPDVVVIKFGGSVLDGDGKVAQAAELIRRLRAKGRAAVVVVSALKGVTDQLLSMATKTDATISPERLDDILSIGEKTSARLMAAALEKESIQSVVVDPDSPFWPIVTDGRHLDASPELQECRARGQNLLLPLLKDGKVPVVCGFLGKAKDGTTTTLGRGGSDTTAVLLGNCLGASEVVLMKDVEGVFSSDPDRVETPRLLKTLDGEEAGLLANGGAKFLHSKALRYQKKGMRIRITALESPEAGTVIEGGFPDVRVERSEEPVSMITLVGVDITNLRSLAEVVESVKANGSSVLGMLLEPKSALLYVSDGKSVLNSVHKALLRGDLGKAVSSFDGLSMITIRGSALETKPGPIGRIVRPLSEAGVNIYGVVTISSSVRIFVSADRSESAVKMIESALAVDGQ